MKIIERGKMPVVECMKCHSVLEYCNEDIKTERKDCVVDVEGRDSHYSYDAKYIVCPVCNFKIHM